MNSKHPQSIDNLKPLAPAFIQNEVLYEELLAELVNPAFDEAYDRLTKMATKLLKVPVSLISIADAEDQYFKSFDGLGQPWVEDRTSPRSARYCRHVVETGDVLLIENASQDEQLKNDPVTLQMGVMAYLGIPMTLTNGKTLGSFCVIDTKPHLWTSEEISIMCELNSSLMREIELRLALRQAEKARSKAEQANIRVLDILDSMLDVRA